MRNKWDHIIEYTFLYIAIMSFLSAFMWYFIYPTLEDRNFWLMRLSIFIVSFGFYGVLRFMRKFRK